MACCGLVFGFVAHIEASVVLLASYAEARTPVPFQHTASPEAPPRTHKLVLQITKRFQFSEQTWTAAAVSMLLHITVAARMTTNTADIITNVGSIAVLLDSGLRPRLPRRKQRSERLLLLQYYEVSTATATSRWRRNHVTPYLSLRNS